MKYTFSEMARVTRGRVDLTPTKDEQQAAHEWLCKVDPDYAGRVQLTSDECQAAVNAAIEARLKEEVDNLAFVNGVVDLSKAAVGSKWKTRDGQCATLERVTEGALYAYRFSGCFSGHRIDGYYDEPANNHKNDIIGPWKD